MKEMPFRGEKSRIFCQTFIRDEKGNRIPESIIVSINESDEQDWMTYVVLPAQIFKENKRGTNLT